MNVKQLRSAIVRAIQYASDKYPPLDRSHTHEQAQERRQARYAGVMAHLSASVYLADPKLSQLIDTFMEESYYTPADPAGQQGAKDQA